MTRDEAEHFKHLQYMRLNSDVYTAINLPFADAVDEYLQRYDRRGLSTESKYQANVGIVKFIEVAGPFAGTKQITQRDIDYFITHRQAEVRPYTVNKNLGQLRAFINYLVKRNYHSGGIEFEMMKTQALNVTALTIDQIRQLLRHCLTSAWRLRIILSLVTGLRSVDVDELKLANINLQEMVAATTEKKTGKRRLLPLPDAIKPMLKSYIGSLPEGQVDLFADRGQRYHWDHNIRGDSKVTRQDLRRTHSSLMQTVGGIGSIADILAHSDERVTRKFYTDQQLVDRWRVNQLPVADWLNIDVV